MNCMSQMYVNPIKTYGTQVLIGRITNIAT